MSAAEMPATEDPLEALETLGDTIEALEEDGADADAALLEESRQIVDELVATAESMPDAEGTDAHQALIDTEAALGRLVDGEGSEEDVDQAVSELADIAGGLASLMLDAMLGQ